LIKAPRKTFSLKEAHIPKSSPIALLSLLERPSEPSPVTPDDLFCCNKK